MSTSNEYLRHAFFNGEEDGGVNKAESIIRDAGGFITPEFSIVYDGELPLVVDAIDFLQQEWDYGEWIDSETYNEWNV